MKKSIQYKFEETNSGEYILIKIPRQAMRQSIFASLVPYSSNKNYRRVLWILCCIIFLLLGIAIGASFHDKFLHESTNNPIWKSAGLQNPNSN